MQKHVVLSSSEAEYIALSEAVKEVKFIMQLLESMGFTVQYPVTVRVDNVGAIFMAENVSTSSRMRHVDCRTKFVREFVDDGIIKIIFVRSGDNVADGETKNVTGDTYWRHIDEYMSKKGELG